MIIPMSIKLLSRRLVMGLQSIRVCGDVATNRVERESTFKKKFKDDYVPRVRVTYRVVL